VDQSGGAVTPVGDAATGGGTVDVGEEGVGVAVCGLAAWLAPLGP
jgi:hypothetical protein